MADKEIGLRVGYKDGGLRAEVAALGNTLRGVKNEFTLGASDARTYAASLDDIRSRSLALADGLDKSSREYAQLTTTAATATRELEKQEATFAGGGFTGGIRQAVSALGDMQEKVFFVTNNLQTLVSAGQTAFNALQSGANSLELKESFANQIRDSGLSIQQYVGQLRDASGGTINDFNLMSAAARSMSLEVSSDVGVISDLLEISRFKARQFGTDTSAAFNDIITGLGRGSPLILDNLGIVLDLEEAYADYAASLGKTSSQLTDAERKQAIINDTLRAGLEEIRNAGGLPDSDADSYREVTAETQNATVALQEYLTLLASRTLQSSGGAETGSGNIGVDAVQAVAQYDALNLAAYAAANLIDSYDAIELRMGAFASSQSRVQQILERNPQALAEYNRYLIEHQAVLGLTTVQLLNLINGTSQSEAAFAAQNDIVNRINGTYYQNADAAATAAVSGRELGVAHQGVRTEVSGADAVMRAATGALAGLGGGMAAAAANAAILASNMAAVRGQVAAFASVSAQLDPAIALQQAQAQLGAARNRLDSTRPDDYEAGLQAATDYKTAQLGIEQAQARIDAINAKTAVGAVGGYRAQGAAARELERTQEKAARDAERAYQESYNNIRGYAEGALSFQGGVGEFDALQDRYGVRNQNESNEVIRRLEAVRDEARSGTRSIWTDRYKITGADLDEIAANAQSAIEALQRGESYAKYLDRDKVLDNIRGAIAADQESSAYIDSLVQDLLPEYGAKAEQAVNAYFGKTTEAGSAASGESAAAMAQTLATSLNTEIESRKAEFENAGGTMLDSIIEGGLKRVNAGVSRLVQALIDAATVNALDRVGQGA